MYTQCPYCNTLFRIHAEQLRAAGGRVCCCRCSEIFNALEHLDDSPQAVTQTGQQQAPPLKRQNETTPLSALADSDAEGTPATSGDGRRPLFDPEPSPKAPEESLDPLWSLPERLESDRLELGRAAGQADPQESDVVEEARRESPSPAETAGLSPAPLPPGLLADDFSAEHRSGRGTLIWSLSILLLLLLALAQLAWLGRDRLLQNYPQAQPALAWLCQRVECRLPSRKRPELLKMAARSITPYPDLPGTLEIHLAFTNQADFPQPCPRIQLNLYRSDERLIARRDFVPAEYGCPPASNHSLIEPGAAVAADLLVDDPGAEATGFEFLFF